MQRAVEAQTEINAPQRVRLRVAGIVSVIVGLLIWELVSRVLVANALFLAAPTQIFAAIVAQPRVFGKNRIASTCKCIIRTLPAQRRVHGPPIKCAIDVRERYQEGTEISS